MARCGTSVLLLAALLVLSNALFASALSGRAHSLLKLSARARARLHSSLASGAHDKAGHRSAMPPQDGGVQVRLIGQSHHFELVGSDEFTLESYFDNIRQSVEAAVEATNGDGDNVLRVLLGGEWRIRKTVQLEQFGEDDFGRLVNVLNELSLAHPQFVLAPGTMFFELPAEHNTGIFATMLAYLRPSSKSVVLNCLPVSYQGHSHIVCKKDECDMLNNVQHQWGYEKLAEGNTYGTAPYVDIKFQGHNIRLGMDICLDSSNGRLLDTLTSTGIRNSIDIYLVSGDGGTISHDAEEHLMANGGLALLVNVMHTSHAFTKVAARGKKLIDGAIQVLPKPTKSELGPNPEKQPLLLYAPVNLPFIGSVALVGDAAHTPNAVVS